MWKAEVLGILSQLLHFSVLDKEMEACKKCLIRHVRSPAQNLGLRHTGWDMGIMQNVSVIAIYNIMYSELYLCRYPILTRRSDIL